MSIRLVLPATFSLVLLAVAACGPESRPESTTEARESPSGEPRRPLNMEDALASGFTKKNQTLYKRIAAEDGWEGSFEGVPVQVYIFPEIVPGYVPTSFFADAVKKEEKWQAHRIVRNVGILCGEEEACDKLETSLRVAGGGSAQPAASAEQKPAGESGQKGAGPSKPAGEIARSEPQKEKEKPMSSATPNAEEVAKPGAEPTPAAEDKSSAQPLAEAEPEGSPTRTPPTGRSLPYSVAIASFTTLEDAAAKQRELAREGLALFIAPVVVNGKPYYRLLAGVLPDRDAASALQRDLVRKRIKREATAWDIRPANLAFHMGTYDDASEAAVAVEGLLDRKIPAYEVQGPNGVYVYAGGYEDEGDAAIMGERIREAGLEAELVERRGETR